MDPADLLKGRTRETRIRRDAQGRWFDGDVPITHPNLVRAFDSWVEVAPDGRYCLRNDINWAYVRIEGAPLAVESVTVEGDRVSLRLSDGREETLAPDTLRQDARGALYCDARGGHMTARFSKSAVAGLSPVLDEDDEGLYLLLGGRKVRPPVVAEPLSPPTPTLP